MNIELNLSLLKKGSDEQHLKRPLFFPIQIIWWNEALWHKHLRNFMHHSVVLVLSHQEVDVALLKLYAESTPERLCDLISVDTGCSLEDCVDELEKHGRLHALGLLYQRHGENDRALAVWTRWAYSHINSQCYLCVFSDQFPLSY